MGYDGGPFGRPVSVPFRTTLGRSAMARKVVNRKRLREEAESVSAAEKTAKKKKTAYVKGAYL